jgi:cyclohexanecarboxylate-CoA ligase
VRGSPGCCGFLSPVARLRLLVPVIHATRRPHPELAALYREAGYWRDRTIGEYFDWCVREHPTRIAVVEGEERLTFEALGEEVRTLARLLRARGVNPGDVVSFQLPNGVAAAVVFWATMRIGAISNPIVPIYRQHELRHILGQARTKVAIVPESFRGHNFRDMYELLRGELPALTEVLIVGGGDGSPDGHRWHGGTSDHTEPELSEAVPVDPDDIALLMYTSGTTAVPKGVLHSHNTFLFTAHLLAELFSLDERDVFLNVSPVTHITGLLNGVLLPSLAAATVVHEPVWEPIQALATIKREQVSYTMMSTPFLRGLTEVAVAECADTSSLRYIGCGGADMPVQLMRLAAAQLCPALVRVYGATESPIVTATNRWDPPTKRTATEGRWMASYDAMAVAEDGSATPQGQPGEIVWRSAGTFLGYLDPALNDDVFTAGGRFRSGDLGSVDDDGYLVLAGRIKDIINRSGEKISAYEVEQLLSEHPAIGEVAVVAQPDATTGERACAYVVLERDVSLTIADLGEFLLGREVARQKVPEDLVLIDALPKTVSGKVQKNVLREWAKERVASREPEGSAA